MIKLARLSFGMSFLSVEHRKRINTEVPKLRQLERARWAPMTQGFTLLELLVVVAIIGLLAAYVGPKYYSQVGKSEQSLAKSQVEAFARAIGSFRLDMGRFPTTEEGLSVLRVKPSLGSGKWNGPYLDKAIPLDPWGRQYIYRWPSSNDGDFDIQSLGKDGQPGGAGEDADITNH